MITSQVFEKLSFSSCFADIYFVFPPPAQFFDEGTQNPELIQKAVSGMKQLSEADLLMLLGLINRLLDTKAKEREGFFRFINLKLSPYAFVYKFCTIL